MGEKRRSGRVGVGWLGRLIGWRGRGRNHQHFFDVSDREGLNLGSEDDGDAINFSASENFSPTFTVDLIVYREMQQKCLYVEGEESTLLPPGDMSLSVSMRVCRVW